MLCLCLELCEFSNETKLGLLFFMGASLPGKLTDVFKGDSTDMGDKLNILSLYARSTGDFSDYGELNDYVFLHWIYNANLAIHGALKEAGNIDDNLGKLELGGKILSVFNKSEPEKDFLNEYAKLGFCMNWSQNVLDRLFLEFGKELLAKEFDTSRAYDGALVWEIGCSEN